MKNKIMETQNNDYISRIRKTRSRFKAADLIRAYACYIVAHTYTFKDKKRLATIVEADSQATALERPYNMEGGRVINGTVAEKDHPWRKCWNYLWSSYYKRIRNSNK